MQLCLQKYTSSAQRPERFLKPTTTYPWLNLVLTQISRRVYKHRFMNLCRAPSFHNSTYVLPLLTF